MTYLENYKISIIIPVFNTETKAIQNCVGSILKQTYSNFEIIIIDDGSEKEIAEFLDEIQLKDFRFHVVHQINRGVSNARNTAIFHATGEYIMFMDSDDYLYSKSILDNAVANLKDDTPDILIGLVKKGNSVYKENVFNSKENKKIHFQDVMNNDSFEKLISQILTVNNFWFNYPQGYLSSGPVAKLYKSSLVKGISFDENLTMGEDTIWLLQVISSSSHIRIVDNVWYYYYQNNKSATNKYRQNRKKELEIELSAYSQASSFIFPNNKNDLYIRYWIILISYYKQYLYNQENPSSLLTRYKSFKELFHNPILKDMSNNIDFLLQKRSIKNCIKQFVIKSVKCSYFLGFCLNYFIIKRI